MHPQIASVCKSIRYKNGNARVTLTSGEQTPLGKILFFLYYKSDLLDLLEHNSVIGYPHNGGQHSCIITAPFGDVIAFIELLKETVLARYKNPEMLAVASELSFISQDILMLRRAAPKCLL